jgi:hypothetical protein
MKKLTIRSISIVLAAVLVLVGAFLWLDFKVIASHTQTDNQLSTYSAGEELPDVMQGNPAIQFSVSGDSALDRALRSLLSQKLGQDPAFGQVAELEPSHEDAAHPSLLVELTEQKVWWTPLYAQTALTVKVAYASDGDFSFRTKSLVHFANTSGPGVKMEGEYHLSDTSWGLMSRPGYNHHLAQQLVTQIVDGLYGVYKME